MGFAYQCGSEACAEFLLSEAEPAPPAPSGAAGVETRAGGEPLVDPNRPGGTGQERPLNSAARRGRVPFVSLLLRAGADPAATDYGGETAVHACARCDQVGVVETLAQAAGGEPPSPPPADRASREDERDRLPPWWFMVTDAGETATFVAAAEGHAGVLRALRAIGALEPSRPNADGVTPMVVASLAGHSEVGDPNLYGQ